MLWRAGHNDATSAAFEEVSAARNLELILLDERHERVGGNLCVLIDWFGDLWLRLRRAPIGERLSRLLKNQIVWQLWFGMC